MEDIEDEIKYIGELYIKDLIEFFMKNYMIDWQRPCGLSKSLIGVPVLFTPEIGRTVFIISHIYQYRQKVQVSELRECFNCAEKFYWHVYSKLLECLYRCTEADFFHISAYAGEVAVFCQRENVPHLQHTLILAIQDLLTECATLNLESTRAYFQNLAEGLDEERIERVFYEVHATLTNRSFQDEDSIYHPEEFSEENSYNNHQYAPQVQSLVQLDASFSQPISYSPLPETMASGYSYPNLTGAQCIPASSSAHALDYPYHQHIPEFFPSVVVPSVVYPSTANSEFDESHVLSSVEAAELISFFNTVNASNSTEHTPTDNSNGNTCNLKCPESSRKSRTLIVNAPVFVNSSEKSTVDSSRTATVETSKSRKRKNSENTISSLSDTRPKMILKTDYRQ